MKYYFYIYNINKTGTGDMDGILRKCWSRYFQYNWKFGLFLILLFGIPRFIIVLESYVSKNYFHVMLVFLFMWFMPFIFLTKAGRKSIGIERPARYHTLLISFVTGAFSCILVFALFLSLFDKTAANAFVYIGGNNAASGLPEASRLIYFCIAVIPSMLFSPIGEEFLYRGIIHGSFTERFGERKASVFDSLAFAVTHIAHFGLVYLSGNWHFLFLPSVLWVLSMFLVSQVFFRCKQYSGSIWGAVTAHSGFNFMMMYLIFYHIL